MERKYEPLRAHLAGQPRANRVCLTFQEIEALLGDSLPESAYDAREGWWNQEDSSNAPHASAWLEAGFGVSVVAHETASSGWVEFVRGLHRYAGVLVDSREFGEKPVDDRL